MNVQATNGVADHEQGLASGLLNTSTQLGAAVGPAVVSAVVTSQTGNATDAATMLQGFRPGIAVATGIGLLGLLVSAKRWVGERRRRDSAHAAAPAAATSDDQFALAGQP